MITVSQIVSAYEALSRLEGQFESGIAFDIAYNLEQMKPTYNAYQKAWSALVQKYAVFEGEKWRIPDENIEAYTKEMETLLNKEVDLELRKVPRHGLGTLDIKTARAILFMAE